MKLHRAPGRARTLSGKELAVFGAVVAAAVFVIIALPLGWLPLWAASVMNGAMIVWCLTKLPAAIREFRGSIPKFDPDYRQVRRR